nr:DUF3073 domain-containing protein [Glycomyces paridis]
MGRGRAKAKQTKVARKLKYHTPNTDMRALERELGSGREDEVDIEPPEKEPDPYAAYADDRYDGDEDDLREDDWLPPKKQLAGRRRGDPPRADLAGPHTDTRNLHIQRAQTSPADPAPFAKVRSPRAGPEALEQGLRIAARTPSP